MFLTGRRDERAHNECLQEKRAVARCDGRSRSGCSFALPTLRASVEDRDDRTSEERGPPWVRTGRPMSKDISLGIRMHLTSGATVYNFGRAKRRQIHSAVRTDRPTDLGVLVPSSANLSTIAGLASSARPFGGAPPFPFFIGLRAG
jgi:hypothetical protein